MYSLYISRTHYPYLWICISLSLSLFLSLFLYPSLSLQVYIYICIHIFMDLEQKRPTRRFVFGLRARPEAPFRRRTPSLAAQVPNPQPQRPRSPHKAIPPAARSAMTWPASQVTR